MLLVGWAACAGTVPAGTTHPYYQRTLPQPQNEADFVGDGSSIDLFKAHLPPYSDSKDPVNEANALRDARAAAIVRDVAAVDVGVNVMPKIKYEEVKLAGKTIQVQAASSFTARDLLEAKGYGGKAPAILIPRSKCLAILAYPDYFPNSSARYLVPLVSVAVLQASPGWCGTLGPGVDGTFDVIGGHLTEGNYDMSEMHLLQMVYRYYDELTPDARELLIKILLAHGRVHRLDEDDVFTSGGVQIDWSRAGYISPAGAHKNFGETENHILCILTARYLTNQLLYQREHDPSQDNRRNGGDGRPDCTDLVLSQLRDILRNDFSEYNAKNYQEERRWALLNLATFAYDHEVRLAARMVLDYVSAHLAVSSSDLRRMVPFRRRNEGNKVQQIDGGFMDVGLLEPILGSDPMAPYMAFQAGNTRALETPNTAPVPGAPQYQTRPWNWRLADNGEDVIMEVLSDYRLPPSIHDLFVNDRHRRFFQRLHRSPQKDEVAGGRNVDNAEIYAGSPSYLITAGGTASTFAIDPRFAGFVVGDQDQQLGVAVTTSFMPTGQSAGLQLQNNARDMLQFGSFSAIAPNGLGPGVANYGVAPDFACGFRVRLPDWLKNGGERVGRFLFIDREPPPDQRSRLPGFFLAVYQQDEGGLSFAEAYDTWLHPELTYRQFKENILRDHANLRLTNNTEVSYRTQNGSQLRFVVWDGNMRDGCIKGAKVIGVQYGTMDRNDAIGDAGNTIDGKFLAGTVLTSPAPAVVQVHNPALGTTITLDLSDHWHPKRIDEKGVVEEAGSNHEVWVDFAATGKGEGDFYRPFNTLAAAIAAVADQGTIKIVPGTTHEKPILVNGKRIHFVTPLGGVIIGAN